MNPYEPVGYQSNFEQKPPVLPWFNAYIILMALLYFVVFVAGIVIAALGSQVPQGPGDPPPVFIGGIYACCGLPFFIAYLLPFFLGRKPWVWIYNIVLICIGLTSLCCLPVAIPLLIFWLKPETKAWYGRT